MNPLGHERRLVGEVQHALAAHGDDEAAPALHYRDFEAMRAVVPQMRFQNEHYRRIFSMYLGARIGNIRTSGSSTSAGTAGLCSLPT